MCWSIEASAVIAATGVGVSALSFRRGDKAMGTTIAYFSAMEALQSVTYLVIDQCGASANWALTALAYGHIAFQPLFINIAAMSFIPPRIRERIAPAVYAVCLVAAAYMAAMVAFPSLGEPCDIGKVLCGRELCSVSGTWHIGWQIPYTNFVFSLPLPSYIFGFFILPFIYGSWRFATFPILISPLFAIWTTKNPHEWPAVWCLFSAALLMIVFCSPLRRLLRVETFPLWRWLGWEEEPDKRQPTAAGDARA